METLQLDTCSHLSRLNITLLWGGYGGRDCSHISGFALAKILEQTSTGLQEIRIPIFPPFERYTPSEILDANELSAVHRILKKRGFPVLNAFIFELTNYMVVEGYRACLEEIFPDLHERGTLRLELLVSAE